MVVSFLLLTRKPHGLDGKHTVFGSVVEGQDVVNAIAQDDLINEVTIEKNGEKANNFDAKIFTSELEKLKKRS